MTKFPKLSGIHTDQQLLKVVSDGVNNGLFEDRKGRALLRAAKLGVADETLVSLIHSRVSGHAVDRAMGLVPPFDEPKLGNGDIELGRSTGGACVRIPATSFAAGWKLVANTGSGKSNLVAHILPQIAQSGVRTWIVDPYKRQHRRLITHFSALGEDLVVLRAQDACLNCLQAKPNKPAPHLALASDALSRLLNLPSRAQTMLRQTLYGLYDQFGIWQGRTEEWPTLFDLYEAIRQETRSNAMAKESALDRLGALLLALGHRAGYRQAWTHTDLVTHNIVFEMAGTSELEKNLVLIPTIVSEFHHRMAKGSVNEPLSLLVVLDDAQRFLHESQRLGSADMPPFVETAGIVRGAGIGLGVLVQTNEGLVAGLSENLAFKSYGRPGSASDRNRLGAELGLSREQLSWAAQALQPGSFVAQLAAGPWRRPFAFSTPLVDVSRPVDDDMVLASQTALRNVPVKFAEEYRHWTPYGRPGMSRPQTLSTNEPILGEIEQRFLSAVIAKPGQASTYYGRELGLSGGRARAIREALIKAGMLRAHRLATGTRGRAAIVLEPLDGAAPPLNDGGA